MSPQAYGACRARINAHARRLAPACLAACLFAALLAVLAAVPGPALAADDKPVIVAFGDSLTAGYGLDGDEAFPVRLEAALAGRGVEARVVNAGVSGDTTAGGRARLDWMLADEPDMVIVELGSNDGLRGVDPAETEANLAAIIERLKREGVRVLLTGMLAPPNMGGDYARGFNALFPRLARDHDVAFYPFFLEGVAAQPALNQGDGMHPNAKGVEKIVDGILPHVLRVLDRS